MRRAQRLALAATAIAVLLSGYSATGAAPATPSFTSYRASGSLGNRAGEPTLGIYRDGSVLFQSGTETLRVTGFDAAGDANWSRVTPTITGLTTLDPILELDPQTGRVFVSQLTLACSLFAFSDDAGLTWTQQPLGCAPGATFDHQSVGAGPFRDGVGAGGVGYPNAVYYCAHDLVTASCGVSRDGGLTFGPAVPAYTLGTCSTNFGHLKVAPDGTAYLPPRSCGNGMGLAVSEDNGTTWAVRRIDGAIAGDAMHPSVTVGSGGTVYYAYGSGELGRGGPPHVVVSRDRGRSWEGYAQLGREHGVVNTRFVTVVAGDDDRAAVAFLGSKTPGSGDAANFEGRWDLYVAFTYDRGATWRTVNATPQSPVQVGPICTGGISCDGNRNLLDFIDNVVDPQGRVLVAIADGCPESSCTTSDRERKATIVRQSSGEGLYAKGRV